MLVGRGSAMVHACWSTNHLRVAGLRASRGLIMKCSEARTLLSQLYDREEPIIPVPSADLEYLSVNNYVLKTTKEDYEKEAIDAARFSQLLSQLHTEKSAEETA